MHTRTLDGVFPRIKGMKNLKINQADEFMVELVFSWKYLVILLSTFITNAFTKDNMSECDFGGKKCNWVLGREISGTYSLVAVKWREGRKFLLRAY